MVAEYNQMLFVEHKINRCFDVLNSSVNPFIFGSVLKYNYEMLIFHDQIFLRALTTTLVVLNQGCNRLL